MILMRGIYGLLGTFLTLFYWNCTAWAADVTVISDGGIVMDQNPAPWLTAAYEALDFGVVVLDEIILKDGFE